MSAEPPSGPPLPEHPELREIAQAMESARVSGDIMNARWRTVFISSEMARLNGVVPSEVGRFYGESMVVRHLDHPMIWGTDEETALEWWRHNVPIMRHYLDPADPDFEAVFARNAGAAGRVTPVEVAPRAWEQTVTFPPEHGFTSSVLSDLTFLELRINGDDGTFLGVMRLVRTTLPESLLNAARPRGPASVRADGPRQRARPQARGDSVRRPRGLGRAFAAALLARLFRPRQRPDRPDRLVRRRARGDRRQARGRRCLCAVPDRRLRRLGVGGGARHNRGRACDP